MRRLLGRGLAILTAVGCLATAADASADEASTDYCRKVTATAQADAALLFAPTLSAQVIRFPQGGIADKTGLQTGSGVQPRASITVGLVDMVRGAGVLDVARADCRRQERAVTLEEVLAQRADIGKLPALEKKLELFRARRPEVQALVRNAEERFAAHTATLLEVHELRRQAADLDRKAWETERDIELLTRRGFVPPAQPIAKLLEEYEARALEHEGAITHVRKIQPWQLNVTAGMTVQPTVDAFGVVELSYNVGGLFRNPAENRALEARKQEIHRARYEVRHQVETLLEELRIEARRSQEQLASFDEELARIARERASLDGLDAPNKSQVLAALTLEAIALEAERAYLAALSERQTSFGGKS
ncbi:hypothetical protein BH11MYX4_BH11MYX4_29420 [soil metagenome]